MAVLDAFVAARLWAAPLAGAMLAAALHAPAAADAAGAEAFVRTLADDAISILNDPELTEEQLITEFRIFVENGFDVPVVGRFALGPYWRAADEAQRAEYLVVFFDYIVDTYAARFSQYSGERFEVGGTREINEAETIVSSVIIRPQAENIAVDWHVRNSGGAYKIIDILFEGLRLGLTLRDEFSTVIRAGGGDLGVLIEDLRNRNPDGA
jgi:phospholipid transport system substrate-binding protein